ncbi:MAG: GMC family oxidoreductase N-terminal domain-containing protein [Aeromicrobium sp.]
MSEVFDYVIVGAGSAGCVLADRLSADPGTSVLLIEAGGSDRHPAFAIPKGFAFTTSHPDYGWQYKTEPVGPTRKIETWSRGRVLGGSSSINGMVYNRGSRADYDHIVELGNPGWGWDEMSRVFRTIEDHELGAADERGVGGPLHVGVRRGTEAVSEMMMEAAGHLGMRRVSDINETDDERVGFSAATIKNGTRFSAARAFLRPALKRPNLTVRTRTTATSVVFEGDDAVGIRAEHAGTAVTFRARREVVLSLGSIATPQLLELSGIGGRDVLGRVGIDVRVDSPQVGEGVREHRCFPLQVRLAENIGYNRKLSSPVRQGLSGLQYLATRRGPIATPAYEMLSFMRTSDTSTRPDAQVLMTPFSQGAAPLKVGVENRPGAQLLGFVLRPTSLGSIHVTSADPHAHPRIDPNYLATEHDRTTAVAMFKKMRRVVEQSPLADHVVAETLPGRALQDDEGLINSGLINGGTGYHACGAVAMGPRDEDAVDSRLRVRGVNRLRVVDVSVLPAMTSGNLNGPIMAMAWRAAELIVEDA